MRNRQGFSFVEVVIALTLLAAGILTVQTAVVRMAHQVSTDTRTLTAVQLVGDRLELIRADPNYTNLKTAYDNSPGGETNVGGNPGLTRVTTVVQHRDSSKDTAGVHITDYTQVTVQVKGTGLLVPVSRSVTVGAP